LQHRNIIVFTALAGLAACVDSVDLGTEAQEVVGGTVTTARPEIGRFNNGDGMWCTANLISPNLILTAAHCLVPQYTATTVSSAARFYPNGVGDGYPINAVHTFSTKRFEPSPAGGPYTTDLAVLHLATAVPPEEATPLVIAGHEPRSNELSTMFGFGCYDRTPPTNDDQKRYFSFFHGQATQAICWGDSGGAVVFGNQTGTTMWGVNSDMDPVWPTWDNPDNWNDVFAAVPVYRKQIEALHRQWRTHETGWDRPGLDYDNQWVSTVTACRTLCENDGQCAAFTWVVEGSGGRCWRKYAANNPIPVAGTTSNLPRRLELGIDRPGGDFSAFSSANPESCAVACGLNDSCKAFTYAAGTCWLKSVIPAAQSCATCTSGVIQRGAESNVNRGGSDIATHNAVSARHCATLCARDHRCEAYTFTGAGSNNCWLKDEVPSGSHAPGMTSGVRRGLDMNSDRSGHTYSTFTTGYLSPTWCQAACAQDSQCRAWSYTPPPTNAPAATCELKNAVGPRITVTRKISGLRGLEMLP
jgi:hypothetical protein